MAAEGGHGERPVGRGPNAFIVGVTLACRPTSGLTREIAERLVRPPILGDPLGWTSFCEPAVAKGRGGTCGARPVQDRWARPAAFGWGTAQAPPPLTPAHDKPFRLARRLGGHGRWLSGQLPGHADGRQARIRHRGAHYSLNSVVALVPAGCPTVKSGTSGRARTDQPRGPRSGSVGPRRPVSSTPAGGAARQADWRSGPPTVGRRSPSSVPVRLRSHQA